MKVYAITFAASAKRELLDLSPDVIERIRPKIRDLAKDPRPPGCKKLQGYKDRWRIRLAIIASSTPSTTLLKQWT